MYKSSTDQTEILSAVQIIVIVINQNFTLQPSAVSSSLFSIKLLLATLRWLLVIVHYNIWQLNMQTPLFLANLDIDCLERSQDCTIFSTLFTGVKSMENLLASSTKPSILIPSIKAYS